MFYYFHSFMISSGKDQKEVQKVYTDADVAAENLLLLGGKLIKLQEVE